MWHKGKWEGIEPIFELDYSTPNLKLDESQYVWVCWQTLGKYEKHLECTRVFSQRILLRSMAAYADVKNHEAMPVWYWHFATPPEFPKEL